MIRTIKQVQQFISVAILLALSFNAADANINGINGGSLITGDSLIQSDVSIFSGNGIALSTSSGGSIQLNLSSDALSNLYWNQNLFLNPTGTIQSNIDANLISTVLQDNQINPTIFARDTDLTNAVNAKVNQANPILLPKVGLDDTSPDAIFEIFDPNSFPSSPGRTFSISSDRSHNVGTEFMILNNAKVAINNPGLAIAAEFNKQIGLFTDNNNFNDAIQVSGTGDNLTVVDSFNTNSHSTFGFVDNDPYLLFHGGHDLTAGAFRRDGTGKAINGILYKDDAFRFVHAPAGSTNVAFAPLTDLMVVTNDGKIGLGTSTPTNPMEIVGGDLIVDDITTSSSSGPLQISASRINVNGNFNIPQSGSNNTTPDNSCAATERGNIRYNPTTCQPEICANLRFLPIAKDNVKVSPFAPTIERNRLITRRVFVTQNKFLPNFGGLGQADTICQNIADSKNFGGDWMALISTSDRPINTRLANNVILTLLNGTLVNTSCSLYDGSIDNPINLTEEGQFINSSASIAEQLVYTGSGITGVGASGFAPNTNCSNYTNLNASELVFLGRAASTNGQWINQGTVPCNAVSARFYCVEK